MSSDLDGQLIRRSVEQPECFSAVFDRHFPAVHGFLYRRVGEELAKELSAETFIQAFRARERFQPGARSALPWLYGIAGNLLKTHYRSEERRLRAYARAAGDAPTAAADGSTEARLDARALRPVLAAAVAELSPSLREVLLLHAWAELSNEEIAQALQCSTGAVRTRLHRARSQVAERLGSRTDLRTEPERLT